MKSSKLLGQPGFAEPRFWKRGTTIPRFQKSMLRHLALTKNLPQCLKNSKDFHLYEKRQKVKIAFGIHFAAGCYRDSGTPRAAKWYCPSPSPKHTQHLSHQTLNCVCEHQGFILIYFAHLFSKMCPKISEKPNRGVWEHSKNFPYKLMVTASLRYSISA